MTPTSACGSKGDAYLALPVSCYLDRADRVEVEEHELAPTGPMVDRPQYDTPMKILRRDRGTSRSVVAQLTVPRPAEMKSETEGSPRDQEGGTGDQDARESPPIEQATRSEMTADRKESWPRGKTPPIVDLEPLDDEEVCYHEGGDLFAEDVERQMAILPEVVTTTDEVAIENIQVGDPESNTPEEIDHLRQIIWRRKHLLIGKGNALPTATVGAVCDIDVGGAAPVAQRVRKVAPQFREKLSDLIKSLLSAKMITPSTSPWASPIVIIIKKNGVDIRLCIDYRLVNSLTRLMVYPMPLISDLLEDSDKVLWYCSLDMASGFWVVSITERARRISAFITPFGLFEWTRMPFGLNNAPQIYLRLIDNVLYEHFRIHAGHVPSTSVDMFKSGEPGPEPKPSVLGRRSCIDHILVTAITWDMLCEKVEALLDACERWNLSISVVKRFWGRRKVDYLGHRVSVDGLEAHPKDLEVLGNLPFPQTLRSMQSFLGSLNYYSRFIEDFAVYAAVLYELREADFHKIGQQDRSIPSEQVAGGVVTRAEDADRWARAKVAFTMLKAKIVSTPVLKHFDPDRTPVIVVYASQWAISTALVQEHDGVYWPVTFTSRTLKPNEINYGIVDKGVLALLRILDVNYTLLTTRSILVLSRHSTLAWLVNSAGFQGRLGNWAALLSEWTLEIRKCTKEEDEILGVIAASITPRAEVDEALIALAPVKQARQTITMPPPTVKADETLLVASFDGSARVKRNGGAYSAIVWKLPEWTIVTAASEYMSDLTGAGRDLRRLQFSDPANAW
uniref:Reverse transcriptase domain-containing protein n=1 Tax=Phytophthora ramorum TaxID=164328 RepID=H3H4Z1_PHYRM